MYPGIIVGFLYGLGLGGVANTMLGALGGLGGAMLSFVLLTQFGTINGFVSLASLIGCSWLGAYGLTIAARAAVTALRRDKG